MKKLQTLYNEDTSKIVQQASHKKSATFLINLANIALIAMDTKSIKDEPEIFNKAWSCKNHRSQKMQGVIWK